jgi:hypothetical protein
LSLAASIFANHAFNGSTPRAFTRGSSTQAA